MARGEEASAGPLCGFLTLRLLLLAILFVAAVVADRDCPLGSYKTQNGICCQLCRAGEYKRFDCISDGLKAMCELCPEGTFMSQPHQETRCTQCGSCGPDEELTHSCSVAQDTMCHCKEGFKRDPHSQLCVGEGLSPGYQMAIVFGCLPVVCLAIGTAAFIFRSKWSKWRRKFSRTGHKETPLLGVQTKQTPVPVCDSASSGLHGWGAGDNPAADDIVWRIIVEHREKLKEWLGENPSPLLDNLMETNTITRNVYNVAKAIGGEDSVQFLLDHFLKEGGMEHFRLWNALHSVRKDYVQLWRMLNEKGEAVHAVTQARPQLKACIGRNPRFLLLQLINKSWIPYDVVTKVKSAESDEDRAEILLDFFIQRGNDDCEKLLFALNIVKSEYPKAREWLDSLRFLKNLLIKAPLFLARYKDNGLHSHIRFKKKDISRAIEDDLEPLLTCLEKRHYFTKTISQDVALMEQTRGRKAAADHVIELTLGRNQGKSRQFLEVLWELRDQHPKFAPIFNDM